MWKLFKIEKDKEHFITSGSRDKCKEAMYSHIDGKVSITQYIGGVRDRYRQVKGDGPEYEIRDV